jgi:hypothetical protein
MALDAVIRGTSSNTGVEVAGTNQLKIIPETNATTNAANIGGIRVFSELDQGLAAGLGTVTPFLLSPEVSGEFRTRVEQDVITDEESFVYTAQNFTKHAMAATTYVPAFTSTGWSTNPTNLLTAAAAVAMRSYKTTSIVGTETVSLDIEAAITYASGAQLPANTVIEIALSGGQATTTPYDYFDATYLRFTPSGAYLVIRNNSSTDTAVSPLLLAPDGTGTTVWQAISGRKYQFIVYLTTRYVQLWINDPVTGLVWLAADLNTPAGYGAPIASPSVQFSARQYQATAPTVASQLNVSRYSVRRGGQNIAQSLADFSSRACESIYSQGTLTTTANQTITTGSITRPAAAIPTNTTALVTSLSGIVLETATLAVGTDGILMAFGVPAMPTTTGTTYAQNRRLRIDGVRIGSSVQTVFAAGGSSKHFYLAYGSTALSLAGVAADTATTKAYRRVVLELVQAYSATAAAGSLPTQNGPGYMQLKNPVYINPGEFVALVTYHLGIVPASGVIQHNISFDYAWE